MKKILIISGCPKRGKSIGLIGKFLNTFSDFDKNEFHFSLLDTGFFDVPHDPNHYPVDSYYGLPKKKYETIVRKIPVLRSIYAKILIVFTFRHIVKKIFFDFVVLYHIPTYADKITFWAHKYGAKVVFVPWGSDILRVSSLEKRKLLRAFSNVDYVVGAEKSNVIISAKKDYNVPDKKLIQTRTYLSSVRVLEVLRGKLSREEMSSQVGIPFSKYNIVCGYNGYICHRHRFIIEALVKNVNVLPNDYQIIFPMTYGANTEYVKELKQQCEKNALNAVFLIDFLSDEQVACLHLITDLFIEIQPTDTGNAFMIESLFAENKIITGRWLHYDQFEQFGVPYYLIDKEEELVEMIHNILCHEVSDIEIPHELIELYTIPTDYTKGAAWKALFLSA